MSLLPPQAAALFEAALDVEQDQRSRFLEESCRGNPDLRSAVERMIAYDQSSDDFLEIPLIPDSRGTVAGAPPSVSDRLGPWHLLERIGEGGMSHVFLAERVDHEFSQRVAVKALRRSFIGSGFGERIRRERQILATLSHPNIARLLDGGTTELGEPYLVMELIEGRSITDYCDRESLSIDERIGLFRTVCNAVHYAHTNLIVHRDLKPSNILVTHGGEPKLLDFGVAKLLEGSALSDGETTDGTPLVTMNYASPEQLSGAPVTTASDVFSLTVVLYQLLCGRLPFRRGAMIELEKLDWQVPPLPSSGAAATEQAAEHLATAKARGESPKSLQRRLEGDLDNIVAKGLAFDVEGRYRSADQLADDLARYLAGRPVLARAPTVRYRIGRFVRRHALGVTATAAVILLLLVGTIQSVRLAQQYQIASAQRSKAEAVSEFLLSSLSLSDPTEGGGKDITVRELLDQAAATAATQMSGQPELMATVLYTAGTVFTSLALYDRAAELLDQSLRTRQTALGDEHPDVAESHRALSILALARDQEDLAEHHVRRALEIQLQALADDDPALGATWQQLGTVLHWRQDLDQAEFALTHALRLRREHFGGESLAVAETLGTLVEVSADRGDLTRAIELGRKSLDIRQMHLGEHHPLVAETRSHLGATLQAAGRPREALPLLEDSLEQRRDQLGDRHPNVAESLNNLASLYEVLGDYDQARVLYLESLEIVEEVLGTEHIFVAYLFNNLGGLSLKLQQLELAAVQYERSFQVLRKSVDRDDPRLAQALTNRAMLALRLDRPAEAEELIRTGLGIYERTIGRDHPIAAVNIANLAAVLQERGQLEEAEALFVESTDTLRSVDPRHQDLARALSEYGTYCKITGRMEKSQSLYLEALDIRRSTLGGEHEAVGRTLVELADLFNLTGRSNQAVELAREALDIFEQTLPAGHWRGIVARSVLGESYRQLGRLEEARPLLDSSLEAARSYEFFPPRAERELLRRIQGS